MTIKFVLKCGLFLAIANLPTISYALAPFANALTANVDAAGDTSYSFAVRYTDDGIVQDNFGDKNVRVAGPGGFDVGAKFVSESYPPNGHQIMVIYSIIPP